MFFWKKNISLNDHDFSCSADLSPSASGAEMLALYDLMVISLSEAEAAAIGILMERGRREVDLNGTRGLTCFCYIKRCSFEQSEENHFLKLI